MKRQLTTLSSAILLTLSTTLPAVASSDETTIKGEVIQVQQRVRTANDGEFDQLRIRTRQGEEMQLQLGKSGSCPGCVEVGDRIRARVRGAGEGQLGQVQSMKVRRNGSMQSYRVQNGELTGDRTRLRSRDGSGGGNKGRQRGQGGNGNCRGNGGGQRGSGAGGSGGSRGGGGC